MPFWAEFRNVHASDTSPTSQSNRLSIVDFSCSGILVIRQRRVYAPGGRHLKRRRFALAPESLLWFGRCQRGMTSIKTAQGSNQVSRDLRKGPEVFLPSGVAATESR